MAETPGESEAPPAILASDADRERSVSLLRQAVGEGRLTLEEFTDRVGRAQTARTDRELAVLARDLPAAPATASPATASTGDATAAIPGHDRHRAFCSHLIRRGAWELPERSSWRSVFGTIDLDLRQARLAGPEAELTVHNVFGTVTVIVPDGVEVTVVGGGLFASQKIASPTGPPIPGGPKLRIDVSGPGGTLHVRSQPRLKSVLRQALGQE